MLFSGKKEIQTYLEISATYKLIIHASRYALIYEFKVGSGYYHVTRYSVTYSTGEGSQDGGSGDCLLGVECPSRTFDHLIKSWRNRPQAVC